MITCERKKKIRLARQSQQRHHGVVRVSLVLLLFSLSHHRHQLSCNALSSPSTNDQFSKQTNSKGTKIISRKSDGRYEAFSFDNFGKHIDGTDYGKRTVSSNTKSSNSWSIKPSATLHNLQSALRSTFLPTIPSNTNNENTNNKNYQQNTLSQTGYLKYIISDNLQDLSTSLRSVLATQRILEGVGVGRAGATALSATLNFLIRDGCGMVASLLFTSFAASGFRRNVKRWKYFADVMVDIGITLEIVAPSVLLFPALSSWFLPLLCLGNVCKALCGVAAGACGGAMNMYWAVKLMGTEEGISEVSAKCGAQRTVVGGVGLVLAGLVAKWLGNNDASAISNSGKGKKGLWIGLYCGLTLLHLVLNWMSLKLVALDWLNGWRLHWVVEEFLNAINFEEGGFDIISMSNPVEVSKIEPLLFLPEWRRRKYPSEYPVRMGVSFNQFAELSHHDFSFLQSKLTSKRSQRKDNYMLTVSHTCGRFNNKRCILIAFFPNSSNKEKAKAYLHGRLVGYALALISESEGRSNDDKKEFEQLQQAEEIAERKLMELWPLFETCATETGWKLDKTECATDGYEIYFE